LLEPDEHFQIHNVCCDPFGQRHLVALSQKRVVVTVASNRTQDVDRPFRRFEQVMSRPN